MIFLTPSSWSITQTLVQFLLFWSYRTVSTYLDWMIMDIILAQVNRSHQNSTRSRADILLLEPAGWVPLLCLMLLGGELVTYYESVTRHHLHHDHRRAVVAVLLMLPARLFVSLPFLSVFVSIPPQVALLPLLSVLPPQRDVPVLLELQLLHAPVYVEQFKPQHATTDSTRVIKKFINSLQF